VNSSVSAFSFIAPLRSSTSEIINLASVAAFSADVIDYKKN